MDKIIIIGTGGSGSIGAEIARQHIKEFLADRQEIIVRHDMSSQETIIAKRDGTRWVRIGAKAMNRNKARAIIDSFIQNYRNCEDSIYLQKQVVLGLKKIKRNNRHLNIPMTKLNQWIDMANYNY